MVFNVIESFYSEQGVAGAQLESFNAFLNNGVFKIFEDMSDIVVESPTETYTVKFQNVYIAPPSIPIDGIQTRAITPQEARLRDLTYESTVYLDITEEHVKNGTKTVKFHPHVQGFKLPVMVLSDICNLATLSRGERVASGECPNDCGGYFIVNGKERVLIGQERISYNHVYVFADKNESKYTHVAEIRSMSEETSHSVLVQARISSAFEVVFTLPKVLRPVPAVTLLIALGMSLDDIVRQVPCLGKYVRHQTRDDALKFISENSSENAKGISEIFPHMSMFPETRKAQLVVQMIKKLVLVKSGARAEDDRDNISLKRAELSGVLVCELLKMHVKKFAEASRKILSKRCDATIVFQKLFDIGKGIKHCFATGNWGVQKNAYIRSGVSQVLSRLSYASMVSHIRRIVLPVDKDSKNVKIRQIHPTQFGMVCVFETPEGMQIGTVKNMAIFARVSIAVPHQLVVDTVMPYVCQNEISGAVVLVNGSIIGEVSDPRQFVSTVREMRRRNIINPDVSVVYREIDNEVVICCDECRLVRPFFRADDKEFLKQVFEGTLANPSWSGLVDSGRIVYLDTNEIEDSEIAMEYSDALANPEFPYCEIAPIAMLGICAAAIPFADHNQSARNCFQASMMKQAIGVPVLDTANRTDTVIHSMNYTQRPLVSTVVSRACGMDDMPSGVNAVVAIACYTGFNQEDSVIINQSAIDRGLFVSNSYKTIVYEEKRIDSNSYEKVTLHNIMTKNAKWYNKLDSTGIVREGVRVVKGDVLVSKVSVVSKTGAESQRDSSICAQHDQEGTVHRVIVTTNTDGYQLIKIVIRQTKIPEIGDKFASRSAQKGTLGMTFRQEDMPFTRDGIVPDIIINPNAIPSRMTIAQLLECVLGKAGAMEGTLNDSTPFTASSVDVADDICNRLAIVGFERDGSETLCNGMTGERMRAKIFIGPTYYQRLKHMVGDKIHARADGDVQILTNQPLEGRSRGGGLRLGEMERDALIAHGTSNFLRERLYTMSDPYEVVVCYGCGSTVSKQHECRNCGSDDFRTVQVPYACRLLFTELESMSVKIDLRVG